MTKYYLFIFTILFLFVTDADCQTLNLIPDPSFEKQTHCPTHFTTIDSPIDLEYWYSPTKSTPDLLSGCTVSEVGVPKNFMGTSYSKDGNNYVGLYLGSSDYREYLTTSISEPLKEGVKYELQFFLKPATKSNLVIDSIQVLFTSDSLNFDSNEIILSSNAISLPILGEDNGDAKRWQIARVEFVAKGGESFLTLGNFKPGKKNITPRTNSEGNRNTGLTAYYYFDFIELISPDHISSFTLNESFFINNLLFEFNESKISLDGRTEIKRLGDYLSGNPEFQLVIMGHADAVGNENYNMKLSLRRANAVRRELIKRGIDKKRIKVLAFGEEKLISENDQVNRRVEFKIIARDVWGDLLDPKSPSD